MENHEQRLVPGQARPPNLGKLRKLAQAKPAASARPALEHPAAVAALSARPRRFRRAGPAWAGALTLASVLAAVASLVLLDRIGALPRLARGPAAQASSLPDDRNGPRDREKLWALAEREPARFAALLGVRNDDPARMEEEARRPERLLSERAPTR